MALKICEHQYLCRKCSKPVTIQYSLTGHLCYRTGDVLQSISFAIKSVDCSRGLYGNKKNRHISSIKRIELHGYIQYFPENIKK